MNMLALVKSYKVCVIIQIETFYAACSELEEQQGFAKGIMILNFLVLSIEGI